MPAVNIQGQNSVIEQPMPSNITDAAISTTNRDRALATAPFAAALKHVKEMSARYWSARQANTNAITEAQKTEVEAQNHRDRTKAEYVKTGTKLTPQATAEDDATIAEAKQERKDRSKKKFPTLDFDEIKRQAPRYRNWLPHDQKYFEGDTRHCSEIRKDVKNNRRIPAESQLDIAIQSPRHSDDAIRSMKAWILARAEKGKATTSGLLQGFKVDYRGEFQLNTNPRVEVPQDWSIPTEYSDDRALVEDGVGFLCSVAPELVEARFTKQILAESDDENAIRDADRPALIAKAKAELLAAQREEEAANKLCERTGIPVFRPNDWPVEVLLEVEAPPKTKPVPVVNAAPVEDADAPDFEDAEAEE